MAHLARRLEPHTLRVDWPLAQIDLRSGNHEEAASSLGRLAKHVPAMRATLYEAAWRAGMPPALIMAQVVPPGAEAAGEYLCFLARRGEWAQIVPAYRALDSRYEEQPPAEMLQCVVSRLSQAGHDLEGEQFAVAIRQGQIKKEPRAERSAPPQYPQSDRESSHH
jgi:hypothetical protein